VSNTHKPRFGILLQAVATALYLAWLFFLAALAWWTPGSVVLSRPQIQVSDAVVHGRMPGAERAPGAGRPSDVWSVEVIEVFKGDVHAGDTLRVRRAAEIHDAVAGGEYLFPLMRAGDTFQVTRFPLDVPPRIYPVNRSALDQLRAILSSR
jgi:hypothetical protein